jgi:DNA-binding NarL/FixJ family response regulator
LIAPDEQTLVAPNRTSESVHGGAQHRRATECDRRGDRQNRRRVDNLWRRMGWDELEVQIALMLQARSSNAEIAQRLGISEEAAAHRTAWILTALCARIRKHGV